jgi:hypothetical protein
MNLADDELEEMRKILSLKLVAEQALNRVEFPENMDIASYYKAAGMNLALARYDETTLWKTLTKKYNLGLVKLDVVTEVEQKE